MGRFTFDEKEVNERTGGSGSGDFLNLALGEEVTGIFVGEPVSVYKHYAENDGKKPGKFLGFCTGDNCLMCQQGVKASYTFWQNFLVMDGKTPTMKILSGTFSLRKALAKAEEKGVDLDGGVNIDRDAKSKTTFTVTPVKVPKGLENAKGIIAEMPPHDLNAMLTKIVTKQTEGSDDTTEAPF